MAKKTARQIGGRIAADYETLQRAVGEINYYCTPILEATGLLEYNDIPSILNAIDNIMGIQSLYIRKTFEDIEAGRVTKQSIIKARHLVTADTPPDEREAKQKKERTEIQRALKFRFNRILDYLKKEYHWIWQGVGYRYIEIATFSQSALYAGKNGIEIDESKFVSFYEAYIKADESITGQLHKDAAEAMTRFFGGALEITEAELKRYFTFDGRKVKPNPKSITPQDYARLGVRRVKTTIRECNAEAANSLNDEATPCNHQ